MGNEAIINGIMADWNCTELEAEIAHDLDAATLKETRKAIAQAVTYRRLISDERREYYKEFLRNEFYAGKNLPEDYLDCEAREMMENNAFMFAYEWGQVDDYASMTEAEIMEAFGYKTEAA